MAHFNFVISENAKWGHAGFSIDCHRMTSLVRYQKIFFYKKALGTGMEIPSPRQRWLSGIRHTGTVRGAAGVEFVHYHRL